MTKPSDPASDAFLVSVLLCISLVTGALIGLLKKQRIAFETVTDRLRAYEPEVADIIDGQIVEDAKPETPKQRPRPTARPAAKTSTE